MGNSMDVSDPISAEFYKNVWLKQASINTTIYEKVSPSALAGGCVVI